MQIQDVKPLLFSKFSENIKISIGDGKNITFWTDQWVDGKSLSILFPNLFRTIVNKGETLAEVFQRKEEQFSWNFQFRRNLFSREVEDLEVGYTYYSASLPYDSAVICCTLFLSWRGTAVICCILFLSWRGISPAASEICYIESAATLYLATLYRGVCGV
ncbi:hypothetical protein Vadar_020183 [Vaccinium darrowii]|uniref:Uncharacterized protein n=1 Tax=Vaccinium darrowii TaxID=229202 RepID=A0ACB7Y0U2_9ERIC|nr:hypothetical protein Vadar_020183 [Vaccinium darrowii]